MIDYDEAVGLAISNVQPLGKEEVNLAEAHRRVLAYPVTAKVSAPPTDSSAMDGYAVHEADLHHLPMQLRIAGESFAGAGYPKPLSRGECVRIFTGAPVPAGADRVIVQEVVRREGNFAIFEASPGPARHIRSAGSDFKKGEILLTEGTVIGPRQLLAIAAADLNRVTVWRRPRLMVLSTGDELCEPGTARMHPECIPESVSYGVASMAEEWGARFVGTAALADRLGEMEQAAKLALRDADFIVVTGGASVGERDFAKQMFANQAIELVFSKVAMKPGKPVWMGRAGGRVVLGLPGNPTSAMVTARLFLVPLLAQMTGRDPRTALRWRKLPLNETLGPVGSRETYARGLGANGRAQVMLNQDSSAQKTLANCELLVRLRHGSDLTEGDPVEVLDF